MALNPGNFLFPVQDLGPKFGDAAKAFIGSYNEQQKRGEEREKALYENFIKSKEAENAPQQYKANAELTQNQANLFGEQFKHYPLRAQAEIFKLMQEGQFAKAQALSQMIDVQMKQEDANYLQQFFNNQGSANQAQIPQTSEPAIPNLNGSNPFILNQDQSFDVASAPQEAGSYMFDESVPYGAVEQNYNAQPQQESYNPAQQAFQKQSPQLMTEQERMEKAIAEDPRAARAFKRLGYERRPESETRQKALSEHDVKRLAEVEENLAAGHELADNLGLLNQLIDDNWQEVSSVVGPVDSFLKKFEKIGTPEEREVLGVINAYSGMITAAMAGTFKGAFRSGEQALIEGLKPTAKDSPAAFRAKVKALMESTAIVNKRNELIAEYINQGMPSYKAVERARSETSMDRIKTLVVSYKNSENNTQKSAKESSTEDLLKFVGGK